MIFRLVWRSIRFAPGRSLLMLGGYALGVGVMVALLSIGDAMVSQSRDRDLVGGGDLAVLPAGIDLETLRTGGVSSLYFDIDLARYYQREVLAGPRLARSVEAAAPWLDDELLYARIGDSTWAISAGGEIPSAAAALGVTPDLRSGSWADADTDRRWADPTEDERLADVDALHAPPPEAAGDSSWAEWHYFNVLSPDGERWLYLTYLVGGDLRGGAWGGQLLGTWVEANGGERVYERSFGPDAVRFEPGRPELVIGSDNRVRIEDGIYRLNAVVPAAEGRGALTVDLQIDPAPHRYLPALDISPGAFPSGYAVPVLRGSARGSVCVDGRCEDWTDARAYHDHNWGVWRDVTWDWGQFQLGEWSIIYGGIARDTSASVPASAEGARFLFALDSLGLAAVLPIRSVEYTWSADGPTRMVLDAGRGDDALRLEADVDHVRSTVADPRAGRRNVFYQLRAGATLSGRLPGGPVSADGDGFFETWRRNVPTPADGP
ncbi:MAG: hypothetical protein PVF05_11985 [Gemmatimonadales bacterium]